MNFHRRAFTLIELLVVVAIVAVLAVFLFPVFSRARENARRASCQSNLKQLGLGAHQYFRDYDEMMPNATDGTAGGGKLDGWTFYRVGDGNTPNDFAPAQGSLIPYIKNAQIFVCPSDSKGQNSGQSYAINSCTMKNANSSTANGRRLGQHMAVFDEPARLMFVSEESVSAAQGSTDDGYFSLGAGNKFAPHHFDGVNILFVDGHVKWYPLSLAVEGGHQIGGTRSARGVTTCP